MTTRTLLLPGTLAALEPLANFVRAAAAEAGCTDLAAGRLHLAVDEVATNAITHAYAEGGLTGELRLTAEIGPEQLRIHVEDTGPPFDPTQREDPADLHRPLEERDPGGLGIYLARRSVDAFLYERRGDRNRVTLILNRHPPGAA